MLARIISTCDLFDEQIESLPSQPGSIATIVAALREGPAEGVLDSSVMAALVDLTSRFCADAGQVPMLPASARDR